MKKERRTKITVETETLLVFRRASGAAHLCPVCVDAALMITVDEAAAIASASSLQIYGAAKAGLLHGGETERGSLLICFNSLKHWIR